MKKAVFIIVGLFFVFVILILLNPLGTSKENNIEVFGVVKSVSEGGIKDLVFELENDKTTYYVNRGLENGFTLEKTKADYLGKKVVLNYAKGWTILAPFGTMSKNINQISIDGKAIYSDCK